MRIAEYTIWLDEELYEAGKIRLWDVPGFIEYDYKGFEEND